MPRIYCPAEQQTYWKCVIRFLLNGRVIAGSPELHLIDIWSWRPGRLCGGREPGVCTLPFTVWGSGYSHSACRGEMVFQMALVHALRTTRAAVMLLIIEHRCTPKSPPVQHTSALLELTATWSRCFLCPAGVSDTEQTPAQRDTDA